MRAKGCGTTPVPRLLRGRASPPALGCDAAPSLDGSRVALLGSAAALVPFAPFRFLAFRTGARVPSVPARAYPGAGSVEDGRLVLTSREPEHSSDGERVVELVVAGAVSEVNLVVGEAVSRAEAEGRRKPV